MRVFDEQVMAEALRTCRVPRPGEAAIMECAKLSSYLEKKTGHPIIHLELGSPGLPINRVGVEAEIAALKAGVGSSYPPPDGLPVLKEASSRFVKAFLNIDLPPLYHIPTVGSMLGAFGAFAAASQCKNGKNKILVVEPSFSANKQQMAILNIQWKGVEATELRSTGFTKALREEFSSGDYAAMVFSNPNNPSWMCLSEDELKEIALVANEFDVIVIEDLAYLCMDSRKCYGTPYCEPYPPTIARYTGNYMSLLSGSKIFSYAGQRIGILCVGEELYNRKYPALAERYRSSGVFGLCITRCMLDMITSGCTASTQWGLAAMMDKSCEGGINFVQDISEYGRRAEKMKSIFTRHCFRISYEEDASGKIGNGFFFTLSYPGMDSATLVDELMAYGISTVSLAKMGSAKQGVRVCSSRINGEQFDILEERLAAFEADHR